MVIAIMIINILFFPSLRMQDVIYRIKAAFNADFEALHRQKLQEVSRVRERNRHIREITLELDMNEKLWEPSLTASEQPERLLTVDHSEVTDLPLETFKQLTNSRESSTNKVHILWFLWFLVKCEIACDSHNIRCYFTVHQRAFALLSDI